MTLITLLAPACWCDAPKTSPEGAPPHVISADAAPASPEPVPEPAEAPASPPPPVPRIGVMEQKRCVVHGFEDQVVNDLVAAVADAFHGCISRAAVAAPGMERATWSLDMWASPDGVPRTQNVAGDFSTDAAFDAMATCTAGVAAELRFGVSELAEPRVKCDFAWKRE